MDTENKIGEELEVSHDEVDISLVNLCNINFAGSGGATAFTGQSRASTYVIALTSFGREFLRVVLD
jgi:hypothetical protein